MIVIVDVCLCVCLLMYACIGLSMRDDNYPWVVGMVQNAHVNGICTK